MQPAHCRLQHITRFLTQFWRSRQQRTFSLNFHFHAIVFVCIEIVENFGHCTEATRLFTVISLSEDGHFSWRSSIFLTVLLQIEAWDKILCFANTKLLSSGQRLTATMSWIWRCCNKWFTIASFQRLFQMNLCVWVYVMFLRNFVSSCFQWNESKPIFASNHTDTY